MQFVTDIGALDDTLIFFTSDNGPWMTQRLAGGSAALFRGAKENTWYDIYCICNMYKIIYDILFNVKGRWCT